MNAGTGPAPLVYLLSSPRPWPIRFELRSGLAELRGSRTPTSTLHPRPIRPTFHYDVPVGRINQWQVSVEHQFAGNYLASVAYVGSHGSNLQFPTDLNQITSPAGIAASAANGSAVQADRPFPAWGTLSGNNYNAVSNYKAIQTQITKRYSSGLTFNANYVWSHFQDDQDSGGWGSRGGTQYWQIGNDPAANYGNSNFDIPNAFKGYAAYDLPFGEGKRYLNESRAVNEIVGGWRIAGTFISQSGNPFTVVNNDNLNSTITGCSVGGTATGGDVNNGCNWFPNVVASTAGPHTSQRMV